MALPILWKVVTFDLELNWIVLHFQQKLLDQLAFSLRNSYSTNVFASLQEQSKASKVDYLLEDVLVVHNLVLLVDTARLDSSLDQKSSLEADNLVGLEKRCSHLEIQHQLLHEVLFELRYRGPCMNSGVDCCYNLDDSQRFDHSVLHRLSLCFERAHHVVLLWSLEMDSLCFDRHLALCIDPLLPHGLARFRGLFYQLYLGLARYLDCTLLVFSVLEKSLLLGPDCVLDRLALKGEDHHKQVDFCQPDYYFYLIDLKGCHIDFVVDSCDLGPASLSDDDGNRSQPLAAKV